MMFSFGLQHWQETARHIEQTTHVDFPSPPLNDRIGFQETSVRFLVGRIMWQEVELAF